MEKRKLHALPIALAFGVPFALGLLVHRQGYNLLDDGLWLLGSRVLADGGVLHRDLFSIYGPARYVVLLPFFVLIGRSVLALAVLKAVLDGLCAGGGFLLVRRLGAGRWSWLVPVGVVALGPYSPRYCCAALLAWLVGSMLWRSRGGKPAGMRQGLLVGGGWGLLSLFGLDAAGYGAVIVLLGGWLGCWMSGGQPVPAGYGRAFANEKAEPAQPPPDLQRSSTNLISRPALAGIAFGLLAVLGTAAGTAVALGILPAVAWQTVVYPLSRFTSEMSISIGDTFLDHPWLREPFAGLYTGEVFEPVWPGQSGLRELALRMLLGLVWIVPVAAGWLGRRRGDPRWGPLIALAVAGWFSLAARSDPTHLSTAWLGGLLLLPLLGADLSRTSRRRPGLPPLVVFVLVTVALGPLLGEKLWLAGSAGRDSLARWERPTAGVLMDRQRLARLESVFTSLPRDGQSPLICWPAQPGINFLLEAPLGVAQATLLGGEVRDPDAVIAEFERQRPPLILLGRCWGIVPRVRDLQGLAPEIWSYLRHHYYIASDHALGREEFRFLLRAPGGVDEILTMPAKHRLPGCGQYVNNGISPDLNTGILVSQSLVVKEFDFSGITVGLRAPGPYPAERQVQFSVHRGRPGDQATPLASYRTTVQLQKSLQLVHFNPGVLAGTRGQLLTITFSAPEQPGDQGGGQFAGQPHRSTAGPLHLSWNGPVEGQRYTEYYTPGTMYLDGRPIAADLYFLAY